MAAPDVSAPVAVGTAALSVVALWYGARLFVDGAAVLARRAGLDELTVGLTVVAVGTSLPEVAVSVEAALAGRADVAVGNVVGSNLYNLAAVLGLLALLVPVGVPRAVVRRDGLVLVGATALAGWLLSDLRVGRVEGVALLGLLAGYLVLLGYTGGEPDSTGGTGSSTGTDSPADAGDPPDADPSTGPGSPTDAGPPTGTDPGSASGLAAGLAVGSAPAAARAVAVPPRTPGAPVPKLLVGLAFVLGGGHLLVESAVAFAAAAGLSAWAVGATVVAAGTSTPEFAVSAVAASRGRVGVSVGNLLGSGVFNLLGVLGLAAAVRPLAVSPAAIEDLAWLGALVVAVVALFWTGRRLSRIEGGLLVGSEVVRWVLALL